MNENQLKQLISKLTGVDLVKQGMAAAVGQVELKNRDVKWIRYTADSAKSFPPVVQNQIQTRVDSFRNNFIQHVPQDVLKQFESLIFVWVGKDESVTDKDRQYVEQSGRPDAPELLRVADFIRKNNIPLWLTPEEYQNSQRSRNALAQDSFNGSDRYLAENGWAWGAESAETGVSARHIKVISDKDVKEFTGREGEMTPQMKERIGAYARTNSKLVQEVVVQMDDTFGVALKDRGTDELLPILAEKWSPKDANVDELVSPKTIQQAKGQLQNLYVTRTRDGEMYSILPEQSFLLADQGEGVLTPNPKAFPPLVVAGKGGNALSPAFEGRLKVNYAKHPGVIFKLSITPNGKMYWTQDKGAMKYPVTKEQAEFLCPNRYFQISSPPATSMGFANPQQKAQFDKDTALLNELRRFLKQAERQNEPNKRVYRGDYVSGQLWNIITVGPEAPESIQTTPGAVGAKLVNPLRQEQEGDFGVTGIYTRKRTGWGIYKNEIPITLGENKNFPQIASPVQGKHGMELPTLQAALGACVSLYGIDPNQMPPKETVAAAQATLEAANKNMQEQQTQAYEAAGVAPQQPALPAPAAPQGIPDDRAVVQAPQLPPAQPAPRPNAFDVQAKTIINKLKKLGQ